MLRYATLAVCALVLVAGCGGSKEKAAPATSTAATTASAPQHPVTIAVTTSLGDFSFRTTPEKSPNAVDSVVGLVGKGFYDGLTFHRVIPEFVIQGGDPNGDGTGGPGYETHDDVPSDTVYRLGMVAMAKGGTEPPGTAGSQFFVVTGKVVQFDGPFYAVVGQVTRGIDTVLKIAQVPRDGNDMPRKPVVIQKMTVVG